MRQAGAVADVTAPAATAAVIAPKLSPAYAANVSGCPGARPRAASTVDREVVHPPQLRVSSAFNELALAI